MNEATTIHDAGVVKPEPPKESPAKDLREIQALIVNGIFPGNIAPQVVKAFHLLESMCKVVEDAAKANESKNP